MAEKNREALLADRAGTEMVTKNWRTGSAASIGQWLPMEGVEKLAVNTPEAAVRHRDNDITGPKLTRKCFDNLIRAAAEFSRDAAPVQLVAYLRWIQPLVGRNLVLAKYFGEHHVIGPR